MTDWILQLLTGERVAEYRDAWFVLDIAWPVAGVLLGVAFCASAWFWHRRLPAFPKALIGVRVVALVLVLFLAMGPTLVARRLEPGTHFVPVLFDDSRSMSVSEYGDQTRAERFVQAYRASGFEDALARTHRVVRFRFGENTARVNDVADLGFDQARSDIAAQCVR